MRTLYALMLTILMVVCPFIAYMSLSTGLDFVSNNYTILGYAWLIFAAGVGAIGLWAWVAMIKILIKNRRIS